MIFSCLWKYFFFCVFFNAIFYMQFFLSLFRFSLQIHLLGLMFFFFIVCPFYIYYVTHLPRNHAAMFPTCVDWHHLMNWLIVGGLLGIFLCIYIYICCVCRSLTELWTRLVPKRVCLSFLYLLWYNKHHRCVQSAGFSSVIFKFACFNLWYISVLITSLCR